MTIDINLARLKSKVIDGGYCIGCGACVYVAPHAIEMGMDDLGRIQANLKTQPPSSLPILGETSSDPNKICPFGEYSNVEDDIGKQLFADAAYDPYLGYHLSRYAGYVVEEPFRDRGSSGGVGKWILYELLRQNMVDVVIQVRSSEGPGPVLYEYAAFDNADDAIDQGSKSVYYPIELSQMLQKIAAEPARYAVVGIPCFIKAIRLLQRTDSTLSERIRFAIGLVCGHLKTTRYAECLAWQSGIAPGQLVSIDFRHKRPAHPANAKALRVIGQVDGRRAEAIVETKTLVGGAYNDGMFRYRACEYCDDVVSETADVTIGDAWLPRYLHDGRGTSIVIVRNPVLQALLTAGINADRLHLENLTVDEVKASQAGGFRDRRDALALRLALAQASGKWHPPKRVKPSTAHLNAIRRKIYKLRMEIGRCSHVAYQAARSRNDLHLFISRMDPLLKKLIRLTESEKRSHRPRLCHRWRAAGGKLLRRLGL